MSIPRYIFALTVLCLLSLSAVEAAGVLSGPPNELWKPVDPAHLAMKASAVEKDADAEALFWEVFVEKSEEKAEIKHYIRIKIFNDRGREEHSKVSIVYSNGTSIAEIAGRTIKPDGSIVPLNPGDIYETDLAKFGKHKTLAKTFAMPAVEPGAIIEYRWREVRKDARFLSLGFQLEIPAHSVTYTIKDTASLGARMLPMNMKDVIFDKDYDKRLSVVKRSNVPAFRREPQMPPEGEARAWLMVYHVSALSEYRIWDFVSKDIYDSNKTNIKPNDEVRKTAESVVAGATTPEQKLERIYDFCRMKIKNVSNDSTMTEEAREKIGSTRAPADTLRRGSGTGEQINWLFAAMANAAGMEARVAKTGDRSKHFMNTDSPFTSPLTSNHIAVQLGGKWQFFDPAGTYLPFGMLRWQEEGQGSLVSDPVNTNWVTTPISPPDKSKRLRKGDFKLNDDGSLEGDVRVEYTGQSGAGWKSALAGMSPEEREKQFCESFKATMPTAELSEIKYENVTDPITPLALRYHVRVPDYAQRTGKRLLLQPAFFQFGVKQLFPNKERRHSVYFQYPWSEDDTVTIALPAGFEPESVVAPNPLRMEIISEYKPHVQYNVESHTLLYERKFFFGGDGALIFPRTGREDLLPTIYPNLKALFDIVHERDNFTVSLKMAAIAAK